MKEGVTNTKARSNSFTLCEMIMISEIEDLLFHCNDSHNDFIYSS